nr:hypothetical protein [Providencia stuartii]
MSRGYWSCYNKKTPSSDGNDGMGCNGNLSFSFSFHGSSLSLLPAVAPGKIPKFINDDIGYGWKFCTT